MKNNDSYRQFMPNSNDQTKNQKEFVRSISMSYLNKYNLTPNPLQSLQSLHQPLVRTQSVKNLKSFTNEKVINVSTGKTTLNNDEWVPNEEEQERVRALSSVTLSDESRVISIDDAWDDIKLYYLSCFRGVNENDLEKKLRKELINYDVLKNNKNVRKGRVIRYMRKSLVHPSLMPQVFVIKCTPSVITVYNKKKNKPWKIKRKENLIFVYRKYDKIDHRNRTKSTFRVMLEGMIK